MFSWLPPNSSVLLWALNNCDVDEDPVIFPARISHFPDMGLALAASSCTPIPARVLKKLTHRHQDRNLWERLWWNRISCNCDQQSCGNLQGHVLTRKWQGQLHQGAILAMLLRDTATEKNVGRLSLVSTSTDAQLLVTCFGVPASVDADVEVVERCALRGSESLIFSLGVAAQLELLITGHASRELRLWRLRDWTPILGDALGGHTGWVRALAVGNTLMVSAACNFIKVWKLPGTSNARMTNSSMKHLGDLQLFKGDVLVTAMDEDFIYAATADGVLHMWTISEALKNLSASSLYIESSIQAHEGRIVSLVLHDDLVITAGHDGHIRVWCKTTLQMKAEAIAAHKGTKLHALTSTSTFLFSGGADEFVRIWDPETLAPVGEPVQAHATGVRSLTAISLVQPSVQNSVQTMFPLEKEGSQLQSLDSTVWVVSGDAQGEVILWRFCDEPVLQ